MRSAAKFTQDELLEVKIKDKNETPVMVTNYNPTNPDIKKLIHGNWNIVTNPSIVTHCSQRNRSWDLEDLET